MSKWLKIEGEESENFEKKVLSNIESFQDPEMIKQIIDAGDLVAIKILIPHIKADLAFYDSLIKSDEKEKYEGIVRSYLNSLEINKVKLTEILIDDKIDYFIKRELCFLLKGEFEFKAISILIELAQQTKDDSLVFLYIDKNKFFPEWFTKSSLLLLAPESVITLVKKGIIVPSVGRQSYYSDGKKTCMMSYVASLPLHESDEVIKELYMAAGFKVNVGVIDNAIELKNIPFLKKYLKATHLKSSDRVALLKRSGILGEFSELITKSRADLLDASDVFESSDEEAILNFLTKDRNQSRGRKAPPSIEISLRNDKTGNSDCLVSICLEDFKILPNKIQNFVFDGVCKKNSYYHRIFSENGKLTISGEIVKGYIDSDFSEVKKRIDSGFRKKIPSESEDLLSLRCETEILIKAFDAFDLIDYVNRKVLKAKCAKLAEKINPVFCKDFLLQYTPDDEKENEIGVRKYFKLMADLGASGYIPSEVLLEVIKKSGKELSIERDSWSGGNDYDQIVSEFRGKSSIDLIIKSQSILGEKNLLIESFVKDLEGRGKHSSPEGYVEFFKNGDFEGVNKLLSILSSYSGADAFITRMVNSIMEPSVYKAVIKKYPKYKSEDRNRKSLRDDKDYDNYRAVNDLPNCKVHFDEKKLYLTLSDDQKKVIKKNGKKKYTVRLGKGYQEDSQESVYLLENDNILEFDLPEDINFSVYVAFGTWEGKVFETNSMVDFIQTRDISNLSDEKIISILNSDLEDFDVKGDTGPNEIKKMIETVKKYFKKTLRESFILIHKAFVENEGKNYHSNRYPEEAVRELIQFYPELLSIKNINSFDPLTKEIDPIIFTDKEVTSDELMIDISSTTFKLVDIFEPENSVTLKELSLKIHPDYPEKELKDFITIFAKLNGLQENATLTSDVEYKLPLGKFNKNVSELFKKRLINGVASKYITLLKLIQTVRPDDIKYKPTTLKDGSIRLEQNLPLEKILGKDIEVSIKSDVLEIEEKDLKRFVSAFAPNITTERMITFFKDTYKGEILDSVEVLVKMDHLTDAIIKEKYKMSRADLNAYMVLESSKKKTAEGVHDFIQKLAEYIDKENVDFSKEQDFLSSIEGKEFSEGYILFIPKETNDLIKIGQEMDICVGRMDYDMEIVKRETLVLLLQSKKEKVCVSFSNKGGRYTLSQAKTNRNKDRSDLDCISELLQEVNRLRHLNIDSSEAA